MKGCAAGTDLSFFVRSPVARKVTRADQKYGNPNVTSNFKMKRIKRLADCGPPPRTGTKRPRVFLAVSTARPPVLFYLSPRNPNRTHTPRDDPMFQALLLLPRGLVRRGHAAGSARGGWSETPLAPWQNMHAQLSPRSCAHSGRHSQFTKPDRPSCLYSHVTARASGCTLVAPAPAADARAALRSRDACRSAW